MARDDDSNGADRNGATAAHLADAGLGAGGRGYHHGDLRAQLISAAREMIREDGLERLSVNSLAKRVGVSSAAPYKHFRNKEELVAAISADGFDGLTEKMRAALVGRQDGVDSLVALGQAYVRFVSSNPELFHLMWGATRRTVESDLAFEAGSTCFDLFEGSVRAARDAIGAQDVPLSAITLPLWSMVHGLSGLLIGDKLKIVDAVDLDEMIDLCTRAHLTGLTDPQVRARTARLALVEPCVQPSTD